MVYMDTIQFAWVVGLFEGEGTCYLTTNGTKSKNRGQRVPFIAIGMTDEEPLRRAHEITGWGRITGPYVRKTHLNKLPFYYWRICAQRDVVDFLQLAWPMLSERRKAQARPVLEWTVQRLADRSSGKRLYSKSP